MDVFDTGDGCIVFPFPPHTSWFPADHAVDLIATGNRAGI